jgi:predicted membrane metal-binding protein
LSLCLVRCGRVAVSVCLRFLALFVCMEKKKKISRLWSCRCLCLFVVSRAVCFHGEEGKKNFSAVLCVCGLCSLVFF